MALSNYEKETIINFNQAESLASVYTMNLKLQHQLQSLASERTDVVVYRGENGHGAQEYLIPKSWIRIRAPRVLSEQQRAEMAERARANFGYADPGGEEK